MDFSHDEISALYHRYAHVLLHRCRRILGDEALAQDVVHETFARVIRHGDEFRRQSSPLTWMYRISTNLALNHLRNAGGRERLLGARAHELGPDRPEVEASPSDHDRLRAVLAATDEETRRVVLHTYFDDCTREEVAQLVGLSVPTVRKRLNTFLQAARGQLGAIASFLVVLELR